MHMLKLSYVSRVFLTVQNVKSLTFIWSVIFFSYLCRAINNLLWYDKIWMRVKNVPISGNNYVFSGNWYHV